MAQLVALDVGTATTRLSTADGSVALSESSVVAIDTRNGDIVDVGDGAWRLLSALMPTTLAAISDGLSNSTP